MCGVRVICVFPGGLEVDRSAGWLTPGALLEFADKLKENPPKDTPSLAVSCVLFPLLI